MKKPIPTVITDEEAIERLEKTGLFRVSRKLSLGEPSLYVDAQGGETLQGVYTDVEATGLDTAKDEIIELGMIPFEFTREGGICSIGIPYHSYSQPSKSITEEITKITGITNEMVAGHKIDLKVVNEMLFKSKLVIAHNAGYDRPMLERLSSEFVNICWGCSQTQIPWKENGYGGTRLEYILIVMRRFYEAHNAINDCEAGLYALTQKVGDKLALEHILETSRVPSFHVWAIGAHFDYKDLLKTRGYYWNPGDDGKPKAWNKEIKAEDETAERDWLRANVYNNKLIVPARFDSVSAFSRFTKRG